MESSLTRMIYEDRRETTVYTAAWLKCQVKTCVSA